MNGQRGAKAGIGVYWGRDDPRNVSEPLTGRPTNNRAEIRAAVRAVEQAKEGGFDSVTVHTDSQFMVDSMTKWLPGWKNRDWTLSSGGPVKNKEDFETLDKAMNGIKVDFVKVKGHAGVEGNEAADRLAFEGLRQ
jgi:ribonuclease HI